MSDQPSTAPSFADELTARAEEALTHALTSADAWHDLTHHGLAARAIADQHEGRYLVELLQNARDAWCMKAGVASGQIDAERAARVAIVVTDRALIVADQGAGFDLARREVLNAVRFLGRSSKGDPQSGFVGHKGIGLKSVLRRCDAFQVWSRPQAARGHSAPVSIAVDFRRSRSVELLKRLIERDHGDPSVRELAQRELDKLPLFRLPHPDVDYQAAGADRGVVRALLGVVDGAAKLRRLSPEPFTTVVRLAFHDEQATAAERSERLAQTWHEVEAIDPVGVMLLGAIGQLDVVRLSADEVVDQATIEVERLSGESLADVHTRRATLRTKRSTSVATSTVEWDVFVAPASELVNGYDTERDGPAELCIGVPRQEPDQVDVDRPAYMYYPLQSAHEERGSGLPFVLHGPFHVVPDRTGLDAAERAHNNAILDGLVQLVAVAADVLCELRPYDLPWALVPEVRDGESGPMARFKAQVVDALATRALVLCTDGQRRSTSDTSLVWFADARSALVDSIDLTELFGGLEGVSVPSGEALRRALRWLDLAWRSDHGRINAIRRDRVAADTFFRALEHLRDQRGDATGAVRAPEDAALAVATRLEQLAESAGRDVVVAEAGERQLPVLPCEARDDEDSLVLVAAAPQFRVGSHSNRVVLYRRSDREPLAEVLPPPSGVPVYFLRSPSWLEQSGRELGLRAHDGDVTLIEEVLRRSLPGCLADRDGSGLAVEVGAYLAALVWRIHASGRRPPTWLGPEPLGWVPRNRALWSTREDQRRGHARRWLLRTAALGWPVPAANSGWASAHELYVPEEWDDHLILALEHTRPTADEELEGVPVDSASTQRAALEAARRAHAHGDSGLTALASPSDPRWQPWRNGIEAALGERVDVDEILALWISFVGCWATPRLRIVWAWPLTAGGHERVDDQLPLPDETVVLVSDTRHAWDASWWTHGLVATQRERLSWLAELAEVAHWAGDHSRGIHTSGCSRRLATVGSARGARLVFNAALADEPESHTALVALSTGWLDCVLRTDWQCNRRHSPRNAPFDLPTLAAIQLTRLARVPAATRARDEFLELPLDEVIVASEQRSSPLLRFVPVWEPATGPHALPETTVALLAVPDDVKEVSAPRAMRMLARLRPHFAGQLGGQEMGLLRRLFYAVVGRLAHRQASSNWLFQRLSDYLELTLDALPAQRRSEIEWLMLVRRDSELSLVDRDGRPPAVLGSSASHYDRLAVRERPLWLDPPHDVSVPHLQALQERLDVERVRDTPPPTFSFEDLESATCREALVAWLESRLPWIAGLVERRLQLRDATLRLAAAVSSLRCVRELREHRTASSAPRPVGSAWIDATDADDSANDASAGTLLVDVSAVDLTTPRSLRQLAWGLVASVRAHHLLGDVMMLLDADDNELGELTRALGIPAAVSTETTGVQQRRACLAALVGGPGGFEARMAQLLANATDAARQISSPLVAARRLDAERLRLLAHAMSEQQWPVRTELAHVLDAGGWTFAPSNIDIAAEPSRALIRGAAWHDLLQREAEGHSAALGHVIAAAETAEKQLRRSGAMTDVVALVQQLVPEWSSELAPADGLLWLLGPEETARLVESLEHCIASSDVSASLRERVEYLLAAPDPRSRSRRLEETAQQTRARAERVRADRWAPPNATPLMPTRLRVASVALAPASTRSGRAAGPSVTATERGEVGELTARADVVRRLVEAFRTQPGRASSALEQALALRRTLRNAPFDESALVLPDVLEAAAASDDARHRLEALELLERALDLTAARGPGFDLIDPLGVDGEGSGPARVEVKTTAERIVEGAHLRVRLTVNELRAAADGKTNVPYVVRVYEDAPGMALPVLRCEVADPVSRLVLLATNEARQALDAVRGGHVWLELEL